MVLFGSGLGDCEPERFGEDAGPGDVIESCPWRPRRPACPSAGVQYQESDGGSRDDPITWRS